MHSQRHIFILVETDIYFSYIHFSSDKPNTEPNPDIPVDETEEFSLVFTTNLNRHTVVYGAEMDGIRCDEEPISEPPSKEQGTDAIIEYLSTKEFIELKTQRHIQHPNQDRSFRYSFFLLLLEELTQIKLTTSVYRAPKVVWIPSKLNY